MRAPSPTPPAPSPGPDRWGAPDPAAVLGSLPDPVVVVDAEGSLLWANLRAEQELGFSTTEDRGRSVAERVHPDDMVTAMASLASVQHKDLGTSVDLRVRDGRGRWVHHEVRGWSGLHDHRVRGVVLVLRRLDDRAGWTVAEGDARRRAAVLDHSPAVTLLLDDHSRLEGASRTFTSLLATDLESSLGRNLVDLAVPEDRPRVRAVLAELRTHGGQRSFEATLRARPDDPAVPFWLTASDLLDDEAVQAVVVSGVAIAELVEARATLSHQATHDPLTGLANRLLLLERLDLALRRSVGTTARVGVIYCDIDGFKEVNDSHGHAVGDAVLVEVARRMQAVLWPEDTVGRMGGDELLAVCVRDSVADVEQAMAALVAAAGDPVATEVGPVAVSLSTGCAVARRGARADDMLRRADADMYAHKRARR